MKQEENDGYRSIFDDYDAKDEVKEPLKEEKIPLKDINIETNDIRNPLIDESEDFWKEKINQPIKNIDLSNDGSILDQKSTDENEEDLNYTENFSFKPNSIPFQYYQLFKKLKLWGFKPDEEEKLLTLNTDILNKLSAIIGAYTDDNYRISQLLLKYHMENRSQNGLIYLIIEELYKNTLIQVTNLSFQKISIKLEDIVLSNLPERYFEKNIYPRNYSEIISKNAKKYSGSAIILGKPVKLLIICMDRNIKKRDTLNIVDSVGYAIHDNKLLNLMEAFNDYKDKFILAIQQC